MSKAPNSMALNRMAVEPLTIPRTMRKHSARGITSMPAGKMVPLAAFPLLREDALRSGRLRFSFEMMETAEVLMNAVNVRVMAYLVPFLALERFNGSMDQLNQSYAGRPPIEGEDVVPFIETHEMGTHAANPIYKYLGLHGKSTDQVNTAYLEAYNAVWNFRAKNRSPDLSLRTRLDTSLAPAFWMHEQFRHIVPSVDFDRIDGEVALNVVEARMPIKGLGKKNTNFPEASGTVYESGGVTASYANASRISNAGSNDYVFYVKGTAATSGDPDVWAELQENGITVSLSNLELARKTQAFAKLREKYNQHDDWIINMLMDGVAIPEQAFKQPMLLADKQTIFGMSKRYATDGGNLTESVVNGATFIDMSLQVPRLNTGGVILIVAEVAPDQLFERQQDPFFHSTDHELWPQYVRDSLDPEKVDVVKNARVDTAHATPAGTFGYEPMNARWNIEQPRIGGRFYRPSVDAGFDEDRQRIWAVETANPVLGPDFYLCTTMHTKPFVVTDQDPFEVVTQGDLFIEGNTQFGGHLIEASDDYEKIMEKAPVERIDPEA